MADPVYVEMSQFKRPWGDILRYEYSDPIHSACRTDTIQGPDPVQVPVLNLRKDIWLQFPVSLNPLGPGSDGAERHAVVWHTARLTELRNKHITDVKYKERLTETLLNALHASTKWIVEPSQHPDQICVLRMVFDVARPVGNTEQPTIPTLKRLNDISANFPVVWHKIGDDSSKIYAIELYQKKVDAMSTTLGRNMEHEVRMNLLRALKASTAWQVHHSNDIHNYYCIELV